MTTTPTTTQRTRRAGAEPAGTGRAIGTAALLRVAIAGSVDDGKSTLVGRLLHDCGSVMADQVAAVSRPRPSTDPHVGPVDGEDAAHIELALLTDGLRAERERGITIDVAYRYLATPRSRIIIADTPGHLEYTRNMVTGASTADVAVILVDARNGVVAQTRRHLAIAGLLGVPGVLLAVNKMDLVGFSGARFAAVTAEFTAFAQHCGIDLVTAVPISALDGDNVVRRSPRLPWYAGGSLLDTLEHAATIVASTPPRAHTRLPVQCVLRAPGDTAEHYLAGQLACGALRVGMPVTVLPAGHRGRIAALTVAGRQVSAARAPLSVAVRLAGTPPVGRGDVLAAGDPPPPPRSTVIGMACHLDERPLRVGEKVLLRHGTRLVPATLTAVPYLFDLRTGARTGRQQHLACNDIGRIMLRTSEPVALDDYVTSRHTGSALLLRPDDGATLTAVVVGPPAPHIAYWPKATDTAPDRHPDPPHEQCPR
jgi:sulfate adenylyltransferase subunit 1